MFNCLNSLLLISHDYSWKNKRINESFLLVVNLIAVLNFFHLQLFLFLDGATKWETYKNKEFYLIFFS